MGPPRPHETGHFYFAQTGHSHFAATLSLGLLDFSIALWQPTCVTKIARGDGDRSHWKSSPRLPKKREKAFFGCRKSLKSNLGLPKFLNRALPLEAGEYSRGDRR